MFTPVYIVRSTNGVAVYSGTGVKGPVGEFNISYEQELIPAVVQREMQQLTRHISTSTPYTVQFVLQFANHSLNFRNKCKPFFFFIQI